MIVTYENEDGEEVATEIPSKFEVCSRCEGHGTHLHEAIGSHAYSAEEFFESFDEEERGEYFRRGGMYDVQCELCHGKRVTEEPDEKACTTPWQKAALQALKEQWQAEVEYERERDAERRYGG